jgi:hypothetical protein
MLPVMGAVHPVGAQLQTCARRRRAAGEPRRRSPHFHEQFVPGRMQKRTRPGTERSDVQMQAAARRDYGARKCPVFRSGRPAPRPRRYGGVSGNENPPACNACRWCSLTVSEAVAARQQANASRRRAAAACRASYVTCRCAISRRCAVGASTSSGAAAATSTPASILPGRKISDAIHYLATLLIAPASVMDLFFLQKARTLAVFVSRRLKSRISLLAAAL